MSSQEQKELIRAAYVLSRAAPAQWAEFTKSFSTFVTNTAEEAVQAEVSTALVAHGRAQSLIALRTILSKTESITEEVTRSKR